MRFLIEIPAAKHRRVARGWKLALEAAGHAAVLWEAGEVPAFDAFDEARPDVVVRTQSEPPKGLAKCLTNHPRVKVVDRTGDRLIPAFDSITYRPGEYDRRMHCDVAYWGTYSPEKAHLIDAHLLPLCRENLRVKIFGEGPWNVVQHLGVIADEAIPDLVASARVCLNLSRDRMSERGYQINGLGGICVSNVGGSVVKGYATPGEFEDRIRHWMSPKLDEDRAENARSCRRWAAEGHTYFHRVADMFREIGLDREAEKVISLAGYPEVSGS